ncbi:MAG: hypothetical protein H8E85_07870 [Candidatus Marinimicrobia bacterium]|nr:hypothetical protein [Candidatus Neomarinimicrobiota bacterium]
MVLIFSACEELPDFSDNPFEAPPDDQNPMVENLYTETDSSSATFHWFGNKFALEFSYMVESHSYIDQVLQPYNFWSGWNSNTTITLDNLDEGNYTFHVKSRFDVLEQDESVTVDFEIDGITEPALRIYPRYQQVNSGGTFDVYLYVENIGDMSGSQIELQFDSNQVEFNENAINCGLESNLFCPELDEDRITILNWEINGDYNNLNALVQLSFNRIGQASTEIIISDATLRNSNNEDINIESFYHGQIEVGE